MTKAVTACPVCRGEGSLVENVYDDAGDRKAVVVSPCPRCSTETAHPFEGWRPMPKWKMPGTET